MGSTKKQEKQVKAAGRNFTNFSSRCFPRRPSRDTMILSRKHQLPETMTRKRPNHAGPKLPIPHLPGLMKTSRILQVLELTKLKLRNPVVPNLCQGKYWHQDQFPIC